MGRFMDWLKSGKTEDEHSDVSPSSPIDIDLADSSIFDTGKLAAQKSIDKNPASYNAPDSESYLVREEETGFDPYNSGRFDTEKN